MKYLFINFLILSNLIYGTKDIDSLISFSKKNSDTAKIFLYNKIAFLYMYSNSDKSKEFCEKALDLSIRINYKPGIADSYLKSGIYYNNIGKYSKSIELNSLAVTIFSELNDSLGMCNAYHNIGLSYDYKGDFDNAIKYYIKALKIREKYKLTDEIAESYNNLGLVYFAINDFNKSLEYHNKCLNLRRELNDSLGIASCFNNLALIYGRKNELDTAIIYLTDASEIFNKLNHLKNLANSLANIGYAYDLKRNYIKSISFNNQALQIRLKLNDNNGIAGSYYNLGSLYFHIEKLDSSIYWFNEGLRLAKLIKSKDLIRYDLDGLYKTHLKLKDYNKAIEYVELLMIYKDSIINEKNQKKILELQTIYETEKKDNEIKVKNLELEKNAEEIQKQKILIFSFLIGFIIILIFSILLYKLFIQKKKANILLAQKNIEVEQKNEEITAQRDEISAQRDLVTKQKNEIVYIHEELTDSINYAKRIQEAVLPISTESRNIMGEHFILFRPKDIVSGDFYWTAKVENTLIVAVADCTGHGVPGAFMSMLGISFLNEIIRKKEIIAANQVLNELRKEIINALQQKGQLGEQKDGMDISLIAISQLSKSSELLESSKLYQAQWAGANNPLWIVRSNINLTGFQNLSGLEEVKPDKMPIAIYEKMDSFTNHEIQLYSSDCIYLMSDGYEDQFGGPKGKKFLSKNLKELIIANCLLTMEEQKQVLEKTLVEWIGDGEQIDDITLLGIKI